MTTPTIAEPGWAGLIHQDQHWTTRDPDGHLVRIPLDTMTDAHRRRVLALLRDLAEFLHTRQLDIVTRVHRRGWSTAADFARDVRDLQDVTPQVWLDDTALVRRLVQLTPAQPVAPRRRRLLPWRLR